MQGEQEIYELLEKNREALVQVVDRLCTEPFELSGDEVRGIMATHGDGVTADRLAEDAAAFL